MIRYRLICPKSHEFEGWFASSDAFDVQVKKKQVECPACGATKVAKALMAPSVVTSEQKAESRKRRKAVLAEAEVATVASPPPPVPQLAPSPGQRAALKQLRELRDRVLAKSDYVGPRFADEARRMHEGGAADRGIHGEANLDEVKALVEDGIEVYPVPVLPDDQN